MIKDLSNLVYVRVIKIEAFILYSFLSKDQWMKFKEKRRWIGKSRISRHILKFWVNNSTWVFRISIRLISYKILITWLSFYEDIKPPAWLPAVFAIKCMDFVGLVGWTLCVLSKQIVVSCQKSSFALGELLNDQYDYWYCKSLQMSSQATLL